MNTGNLKPIKQTHAQAVENGRQGGKASGEARRRRRTLRQILLSLRDKPSQADPSLTNGESWCISLVKQVEAGNIQAFRALREALSEREPTMFDLYEEADGELEDGEA